MTWVIFIWMTSIDILWAYPFRNTASCQDPLPFHHDVNNFVGKPPQNVKKKKQKKKATKQEGKKGPVCFQEAITEHAVQQGT